MIYTSYFGNYRNFPKDSYIISIARFSPNDVEQQLELAPTENLLQKYKHKEIDEFIFSTKYIEQLQQVNKKECVAHLRELEKIYQNVILCCYEKKGDFCHRHILANWLKSEIQIEEL